jgi:hypothetical protein
MDTEKNTTDYTPALGSGQPNENMSAGRYLATRFSTVKPTLTRVENPFKLLALLNLQQWLFFLVAFFAWSWDAFDFFTVSLTVENLAETFGKTKADITWGITLVLMLRSVGSIIFGLAADRYGRKWPFIINNVLFIILELATGFCSSYESFLGVRALFGIAMGGLYGNAAATGMLLFIVHLLWARSVPDAVPIELRRETKFESNVLTGNSTRRLPRAGTWYHKWDAAARLCFRVFARYGLRESFRRYRRT